MKNYAISTIIALVVILFLVSVPGAIQNSNDYDDTRDLITETFELIDEVCDSGCTDYPEDWISSEHKLEAENYCLRQCQDRGNMKRGVEEEFLANFLYRSNYHHKVGVAHCLLGLNCLFSE
ncbi:hypothetical protein ACFL2C_01235 [Patescibacteria group bacterium]